MPAWMKGGYATPSPSNTLLACITDDVLRISFTNNPQRCIDFPLRLSQKNTTSLRWAPDSSRVALFSTNVIDIIDLEDEQSHIHLDNGSAGLGRLVVAEFFQPDRLITIWEFGRAKIWNLSNGHAIDIENIKTSADAQRLALRPHTANPTLAYLSRPAADDMLVLQFQDAALAAIKMPTTDAKAIQWSPDGHWLTILDTPRQLPNVYLCTPDGHVYKSYPAQDDECAGLGIKAIVWSPDSQKMALTRFDGCTDIITGTTLSQVAIIEHSTLIQQNEEVKIWQECVSASTDRSYKVLSMPVSPPLSRTKQTVEPRELGVAEAVFSCDSCYLATRDETMLSTVWIWNVQQSQPHLVIIQHSNVRKLHWHPNMAALLLIDCGENILYTLDIASGCPPESTSVKAIGNVNFSFLDVKEQTVLATTKDSFCLLRAESHMFDAAVEQEDSLFEILSGRADAFHTSRIALDVEAENTVRLDDTFDGRLKRNIDPLDDSEIF